MDNAKKEIDYSLCLVTDRTLMSTATLDDAVAAAIKGGVTMIQLREKDIDASKMFEIALKIKPITDAGNVPLIINDRVDIALAINASGVHVGQSDIPASVVRKIIPSDMILGVSATNTEEAIQAEKDGADYIGVGAMFQTGTKTDAKVVSMEELEAIRKSVSIPIMLIGGIDEKNIEKFADKGVDGIAVVSAIISKPDIKNATEIIKNKLNKWRK